VKSLSKAFDFYSALGFEKVDGAEAEGWMVLENSGFRIGLSQGHIPENAITFFGGDVEKIANHLTSAGYELASGPEKEEDGSLGATIKDPDGNLIYFNS
jgi:predicted lactoylglutathione lyase